MSIRDLRQKFFAAHVCGCCNAPWPLLSSIIEHIGRLEKNTVDSVTVADTKTVAPGQPAYVVNQGTAKNVKLEFGIPEGIPGVSSVEVGETLTLEPGSDAYVRNVGDYDHLNLEFGIPQGAKGDPFTFDDFTEEQLEELRSKIAFRTINTIEFAEPVWREINTDTTSGYDDMQGGVVYSIGTNQYYTFAMVNDIDRKLKTVSLYDMSTVSNIDIPSGHYGSIGFQDGMVVCGNYDSDTSGYGSIYFYDFTDPSTPDLKHIVSYDTSINPVGVTSYKDGKLLITGDPLSGASGHKGVYQFDIETTALSHLFDYNQYLNGNRPQPGSYDPVYDCFVAPTTDNFSLTYYDMDGKYNTCIHLRNTYNWISVGELENFTPMGSVIYFAGYNMTHLIDSVSMCLFKFDALNSKGKTEDLQSAFQTKVDIDVDANDGLLIPNPVSGEPVKVLFPDDAVNIAKDLTNKGVRQCNFRFYGNHDCGLYINDLNCSINTLNGYFARGIHIVNSTVTFAETRSPGFENANAEYSKLTTRNSEAFGNANAIDKPAYIAIFSSTVFFNAHAMGNSAPNSSIPTVNIYGVRLVDSIANFYGVANLRHICAQYSTVYAESKNVDYFNVYRSNLEAATLAAKSIANDQSRIKGRVSNNLEPSTEIEIPNYRGELGLAILVNSIRAFYAKYTAGSGFSEAAFQFNGETFRVQYQNGKIITPSNTGYTYVIYLD